MKTQQKPKSVSKKRASVETNQTSPKTLKVDENLIENGKSAENLIENVTSVEDIELSAATAISMDEKSNIQKQETEEENGKGNIKTSPGETAKRSVEPLSTEGLDVVDAVDLPASFYTDLEVVELPEMPSLPNIMESPEKLVTTEQKVQLEVLKESAAEENINEAEHNKENENIAENIDISDQKDDKLDIELTKALSTEDALCDSENTQESLAERIEIIAKKLNEVETEDISKFDDDSDSDCTSNSSEDTISQEESSDNNSLQLAPLSDSDNESDSSFSPISFENSDEEVENANALPTINDEETPATNLSSTTQGPVPTSTPKSEKQSRTPSPANLNSWSSKSQLPNLSCSEEPLSLNAGALPSLDSVYPLFKQQEATKTQSAKRRKKSAKLPNLNITDDNHNDDSSSTSSSNELPSLNCSENKRKYEETMINYLTKMSHASQDKEEKCNADSIFSANSVKNSDSDDSVCRRKAKTLKIEINNTRDFYEDDSSFDDAGVNSDDDEEDKIISELPFTNIYIEYEQLLQEILKLVDKVPNRFKYEINGLLYPTLAMLYLCMAASGKFRKGKSYVETYLRHIDHSYMGRVDKLMVLRSSADIPNKAIKLLSDDNEQIAISMNEDTYQILLIFIQAWSRPLQMTFLRLFDLVPIESSDEPRQHPRLSSATLEKLFWATPQRVHEKKEHSPRPTRRRRFKKYKPSPTRNIHLPTGNRLYTPTPKRWDLERHKDDEEHRVPLSRESLPSAYLYTANESVESVICASFSNKNTMLSIGTKSSTIHVYALTASKLVQLKSAKLLKSLDTGVSGIDESMLDATKKKMRRTLYGHQGAVYGCAFAPHDRFLLSCSQDATVRCWCLLSWSCVVIYPGHCAAIYSICYAPFGYYFATASDDRTARIWTQDNKKPMCIFTGHLAEVICCQFHPNRHYLATGSADCTVRLWDIIKAVQVRIFSGHKESVNALAFSICGRYLVTGADDHFIIVWDTDKEELVRSLAFHMDSINCIEFALDNKIFVAGGQDCLMTTWDFELLIEEHNSDKLKQLTNREFRRSELTSKDILITAYASKGTPFNKLRFTNRNLLLGCCVKAAKDVTKESSQKVEKKAKYTEWLEFLDILVLKACFEKPNTGRSNKKLVANKNLQDVEVINFDVTDESVVKIINIDDTDEYVDKPIDIHYADGNVVKIINIDDTDEKVVKMIDVDDTDEKVAKIINIDDRDENVVKIINIDDIDEMIELNDMKSKE